MQKDEEIAKKNKLPGLFTKYSTTRAAVWAVAWPAVAIGLLRTALGQVDAYQIGRLGSLELQAMGAASFLVWTIYILGDLAAVGVHALCSEAEGRGDRKEIAKSVCQGLWFSLIISFFTAIITWPRIESNQDIIFLYLKLIGIENSYVTQAAADYLRVTAIFGTFPLAASAVASSGFKGIGETRAALAIAFGTVALNAILNIFFIQRLGVPGAAWATNLSALVAFFASILVLAKKHHIFILKYLFHSKNLPSFSSIIKIAQIGAPIASSGFFFSLIYIVLGRLISAIDPIFLAALGIGHRIEALAYSACEGYAIGAATCVGIWLGADEEQKARHTATTAARIAIATLLPVSILTLLFAPFAASFFSSGDIHVATAATNYLRIVALVFPVMAIDSVYEGSLTGAQRTLPALVATVIGSFLRIPLALCLIPYFGVNGVWIAIAATTLFKAPAKYFAFRTADIRLSSSGTTRRSLALSPSSAG
uniref:Multidrug-efflux transporter n=1 Tax=Aureoumbra lagunensis TaxID=44058 RepID=A0A7S3K5A1_9STRA